MLIGPHHILSRLRATTALVAAASLFIVQTAGVAYGLPAGGQVNGGQASITSSASQLTVNQSSQRAVIDWSSFDIGSDERGTVRPAVGF